MIYIGCHLTVTNGYEAMGHQMVDFGGSAAWAGVYWDGCNETICYAPGF